MPEQVPLPLEFIDLKVLSVDEIWNGASSSLLRRVQEDRRIERKSANTHGPELADYLSMWANTIDGGLIAVGIENDGTLSGCCRLGEHGTNRVETEAHNHCPDAHFECRRVVFELPDATPDYVLLMRVYYNRRKVVRSSRGEAYIRIGDEKHKLTTDEVRDIEGSKGQVDAEQEPCPQYEYPDDFDADLVAVFVAGVRDRNPNYPQTMTVSELLELRHLGKRQHGAFVPNTACVVMFARDPLRQLPGSKIRFLRYEGQTEGTGANWKAIKDLTFTGPLPNLIEAAADALRHQLREYSRLGADGKFTPTYEYPEDAWFEAVVNACAHRSYGALRNMNIFIRMFEDRLEFESPGGFPPPVTPDNIYDMHQPRNPHLMDALMHLSYVKCAREGTRRMRESMQAADLPVPHFAQKFGVHHLVKVTLKNNSKDREKWIDSDAATVVGEDIAKTLTEPELRAVNFIAQYDRANTSEIKRLLKNDWETSSKLLHRLVGKGILRHVHRVDRLRDPKAHFVLVDTKTPGR